MVNMYAVWANYNSDPATIGVAPMGYKEPGWNPISPWGSEKDAWKQACTLHHKGDLMGKKYHSPDIAAGRVKCD